MAFNGFPLIDKLLLRLFSVVGRVAKRCGSFEQDVEPSEVAFGGADHTRMLESISWTTAPWMGFGASTC